MYLFAHFHMFINMANGVYCGELRRFSPQNDPCVILTCPMLVRTATPEGRPQLGGCSRLCGHMVQDNERSSQAE